jgi:phosphatidate cytidylyltransferase
MKQRVITGILFTLIIAALILPGYKLPQLTLFTFFIIAVLCIIEVTVVVRTKFPAINPAASVVGSLGIFIPILTVLIRGDLGWRLITEYSILSPNKLHAERQLIIRHITESISYLFIFIVLFSCVILFYVIVSKGPAFLIDAVMEAFIPTYIVVPMVCGLLLLYVIPNGYMWFLAAVVIAWISDVFAYFIGITIGRHKIIPQISPKKTWEGTIGGIAGGVFVMILWMTTIMIGPDIVEKSFVYRISFGIIAGLLLSVGSQFGDWFASSFKRWSQVKDYGKFLPGHGGFMDRFDSVLFAFPIMLISSLVYYLL